MKLVFIAHAIGIGGGPLSSSSTIQYLLDTELLKKEDCLIIHDKLKEISDANNDVYFNLKKTVKHFECTLPFSPVYKGTATNFFSTIFNPFKGFIILLMFFFNCNKILRQEKITTVHLNSMVLWPLLLVLPKSMKLVIHIREVPNDTIRARIAVFVIRRYATKIISIDPISDLPFSDSGKSIVIINPFNMTQPRQLRSTKTSIKKKLGISEDTFIVSIFGNVSAEKGLGFFIRVVKASVEIKNLVFFIIGKPSGLHGENCVQKLDEFKNVRYFGEQADTSKYYAITDVVIRCEDYLPLGRTVWEGIFAGGVALVPVNENDDVSVIQQYLGKYIYTYPASRVESCIDTLKKIRELYPATVIDSGYPVSDNLAISAKQFFETIQS